MFLCTKKSEGVLDSLNCLDTYKLLDYPLLTMNHIKIDIERMILVQTQRNVKEGN